MVVTLTVRSLSEVQTSEGVISARFDVTESGIRPIF